MVNVLNFCTPKFLTKCPEGAVLSGSTLFAIPLSIFRNDYKKQNLGQKVWNKVFEILGHLLEMKTVEIVKYYKKVRLKAG